MFKQFLSFVFLIVLIGCGGGNASLIEYKSAYSQPEYNGRYGPGYASHSDVNELNRTIHIGADVGPRQELNEVDRVGGTNVYMGAVRDGVGRERLHDYLGSLEKSGGNVYPFRVQPVLYVTTNLNDAYGRQDPHAVAFIDALQKSRKILNDALPPEFQIRDPIPGETTFDEGALSVRYMPRREFESQCGTGYVVGCGGPDFYRGSSYAIGGNVYMPDDFDIDDTDGLVRTLVHEMIHALGVSGHVDNVRFPDAIMGTQGASFKSLGFVLPRIDREILQVMYMGQVSDRYNDLSDWMDVSFHMMGELSQIEESPRFGVALFNGLAQPWARGPLPEGPITQSGMRGNVTWNGAIVGFAGVNPVVGDTRLTVNLNRPGGDHDLVFSNIYIVGTKRPDNRAVFFSHRISYDVRLNRNTFSHSSDEGIVSGSFVGFAHEGMIGTLKRTDLVGAFGGTRSGLNDVPQPSN